GKLFRVPGGEEISAEIPLSSTPYLQMIKYWRLLDTEPIAAGMTRELEVSQSYGLSYSMAYQLSIMVGAEASGDPLGIFSFKTEITSTFSTSVTYTEQQSKTVTFTQGPYDTNVRVNTWQEVHEFRIVDENGRLFTDPNYEFKSMTVGVIGTENIVTAVDFF
ncbi:MAG: hypothetical protein KDC54_17665, partial [Lewinella sp.]|nr:hypothetical protein [Lewinella sp.]